MQILIKQIRYKLSNLIYKNFGCGKFLDNGLLHCKNYCHKKGFKQKLHHLLVVLYLKLEILEKNITITKEVSRNVWNTYWDKGMGKWVTSYDDIKAFEKQGYVKLSADEAQRITKENRKHIENIAQQKRKKSLWNGIQQIKQGRSYYKELIEKSKEFSRNNKEEAMRYQYYMSKQNKSK